MPNSTFWALGTHASRSRSCCSPAPSTAICSARPTAGESWFKDWRDFSEITSVAWTPVVAAIKAHPKSTLGAAPHV
ncbi:MAG: hypothetical protein QM777_06810 [Pseudorhodoferax sp.]